MHRPKRLLPILVLLACFAGCSDDNDNNDSPSIPHGHLVRHVSADGLDREYVVHVPEQIDGEADVPVVFMLHGTSGTGEEFYTRSGWVEKANEEGFIAVFPTALIYCLGEDTDMDGAVEESEYSITTKWAAGQLGTAAMPLGTDEEIARFPAERQALIQSRTVKDDVAFMDAMVAAVESEFPVDASRLYVTGFSNGGGMSARLLVERSNTFAAFAIAAGGLYATPPPERPAPAVFSVGSLDEGFAFRAGVSELPVDESLADIPYMQGIVAVFAAATQLDPTQRTFESRLVNGKTVASYTLDHSLVGASNTLILAVIDDATHEYPNGSNHPVVMADQLWGFFEPYRLP